MRISDWSSDVCSSDLAVARPLQRAPRGLDLVEPGFDRVVTNAGFAQRLAHDPRHVAGLAPALVAADVRSEEHTSELQSLIRISYAVFCLEKKKNKSQHNNINEICI